MRRLSGNKSATIKFANGEFCNETIKQSRPGDCISCAGEGERKIIRPCELKSPLSKTSKIGNRVFVRSSQALVILILLLQQMMQIWHQC